MQTATVNIQNQICTSSFHIFKLGDKSKDKQQYRLNMYSCFFSSGDLNFHLSSYSHYTALLLFVLYTAALLIAIVSLD